MYRCACARGYAIKIWAAYHTMPYDEMYIKQGTASSAVPGACPAENI